MSTPAVPSVSQPAAPAVARGGARGAVRDAPASNRHSRKLTLRAAVALLDRLEQMASAPEPPLAPSMQSDADGDGAAPSRVRVSRDGPGGVPSPTAQPFPIKSVSSVIKALVQKVIDLKAENESLKGRAAASAAQVSQLSEQVKTALSQMSSAYERLDALQVEHARLQEDVTALTSASVAGLQPPGLDSSGATSPRVRVDAGAAAVVASEASEAVPEPTTAAVVGVAQQHTKLVQHVNSMAVQLTDTVGQLRKERTARKAMATAYKDLLSSHMRMLSAQYTAQPGHAAVTPMDEELDVDVSRAVAAVAALNESLTEHASSDGSADTPAAPAAAQAPSTENVGTAEKPSGPEKRASWLMNEAMDVPPWLPGMPALPISNDLMAELSSAELQGLIAAIREYNAVCCQAEAVPSAPTDRVDFGLEAAVLQRLVDTTETVCAFASYMHSLQKVPHSAVARHHHRLGRLLAPLPDPSMAIAHGSGGDGAQVSLSRGVIVLCSRVLQLVTVGHQFPVGAAGSFPGVLHGILCDLNTSLLPVMLRITAAVLFAARRVGMAATHFASRAESSSTTTSTEPVDVKTKLEWYSDQLFRTVSTATWQPHASRTGDPDDDKCAGCGVAFSMFNRRHHCRCCGDVVCAACSSHTLPLADMFVPVATVLEESKDAATDTAAGARRRHSVVVGGVRPGGGGDSAFIEGFHECVVPGQQRVCDDCFDALSSSV